ncbi:MAG: delta fatty acid desaturase [Naasia sp.]|jgi:fatty acid desaturase|uniref:fatty acid desaturase family protein n=1 Tax=Naasia sp. TaxID=2546198 RepID=UPI00262FEACB|nr:acyl-CoA desaturase [Naasia sp.]MCU1569333.1 delta fatty acid desaturase [Naasia sp.]
MTSTTTPGFRTTVPRRTRPGGAQAAHASDYTALANEIKAAGLLERRPLWYAVRCLVLAAAVALGFVLLFTLGQTWWQLLVAVYFSIVFTQVAFLSHDAAHRQMFESGKRNEWFSRIVGNSLVGLSYGWWMNKHSRHHANPNKVGKDNDITPGAIAFTKEDAEQRTGAARWITRKQGYFFIPILLLAGIDLHVNAVKLVLGKEPLKHRAVEASLLALRLIGFPVLVFLALGPLLGAVFMLVQLFSFGLYMAGSFAPNHKGMMIIGEDVNIDFLRRQVLTSRNISGSWVIPTAMGGLNYQVEHHLFPNMPSVNLRKARPIVMAYCEKLDVPYTETKLLDSYRIIVRYIHKVGIGAADPFDCPLAAAYRTV